MPYKFKVGDRVKAVKNSSQLEKGQTGTIIEVDDVPFIRLDNGKLGVEHERNLELVKEDK